MAHVAFVALLFLLLVGESFNHTAFLLPLLSLFA
jgi:hypothetical protein